jgi:hypothetical protein
MQGRILGGSVSLAICRIGLMRPGVQMVGITAPPIVTLVTNHRTSVYRAIEQHVCAAMCRARLGEIVKTAVPITVSRSATASAPFPAIRWMPNGHFAAVVLPRAGAYYDVLHQLNAVSCSWSKSGRASPRVHSSS